MTEIRVSDDTDFSPYVDSYYVVNMSNRFTKSDRL